MRPIRWKKKYLTGNVEVDNRHLAFTKIVNELVTEAGKIEHCQDLNELHQQLSVSAETIFKTIPIETKQLDHKLTEIAATYLPLPAKNGAACCHCNLCDRIEQQIDEWTKGSNSSEITIDNTQSIENK